VPNWKPNPGQPEGTSLLEAVLATKFGSLITEPLYSLGHYDDSVTGFAQEILYCKLSVSLSANGSTTTTFMSGSGIYQDPTKPTLNQTDIQNFMTSLASGSPPGLSPLYNADAPNVLVKNPCYVVFELHPPAGLKFVSGDAAIKMQGNLPAQYVNLWHYGVDWVPTPDISPTTEDCLLIYFGVVTVDDATLHINDRFNINLQTGDQPDVNLIVIDPAIKNRGPKKNQIQQFPPPPRNAKPARKKAKVKLKKAA